MTTDHFEFTISHVFDIPRDIMWHAWTDANQLKQWFGPKGCEIAYSSVDLREGGAFRCQIQFPDGGSIWGKWIYKTLKAPEKLVAIVVFTDETGEKIVPHPGIPSWPLEVLSDITFVDTNGKTQVIVKWQAYQANAISRQTFADGKPLMQQGWGGTFERLGDYFTR